MKLITFEGLLVGLPVQNISMLSFQSIYVLAMNCNQRQEFIACLLQVKQVLRNSGDMVACLFAEIRVFDEKM